jgi:hypothetical protein
MDQNNESGYFPAIVDAAYATGTLMALDSTSKKFRQAGTADTTNVMGHLTEASYADLDRRTIRSLRVGTSKAIAADTVAAGTAVRQFAAGTLGSGGAGTVRGIPLVDATVGEFFEYWPIL